MYLIGDQLGFIVYLIGAYCVPNWSNVYLIGALGHKYLVMSSYESLESIFNVYLIGVNKMMIISTLCYFIVKNQKYI